MKKTVKLISLILALLMMAMVMFACNSDTVGDDEDGEEKSEEKYVNLTPEGVYNKVGKAKDVTVTYIFKSENSDEKQIIVKDSDNVKLTEIETYDGDEWEESYYVNLKTTESYRKEGEKWFYEANESAKYRVERYINLSMLEEEFGTFFKKENAFESDNYNKDGDVFTFKSDLIADMNEGNRLTVNSLSMTRSGSVYTYKIDASADGQNGKMDVIVDFNATEVKLPENAIEIKYEDYTVTVKDVNGNPINDIYVNIRSGEDEYEDSNYTDEDGKTTSNLLYGKDYYIVLNYYGYGDIQYVIEDKYYFDGTSANITLAIKEKPVYKVTVKGEDGTLLQGVDVSLYETTTYGDSYRDWEETDENGYVEFKRDDTGNFYVTIDEYDVYGYKVEEKYYFDGETPLVIVLEEKPAYKVTVKDTNGNPVEDASLSLYDASGNYITGANTDSNGLAKLVVEQEYNYVYVTIWSPEEKYIIEDTYSFSNGSKEMDVVFEIKASITVRVLNSAGDSIYNVRVFLRDKNGYSWDYEDYDYTDNDGYVVFYDFDETKEYYITIDNVPYVYNYEESYDLVGDTLTIYLTPKA